MVSGVIRQSDSKNLKLPNSISTKTLAQESIELTVNRQQDIHVNERPMILDDLSNHLKDLAFEMDNINKVFVVLKVDGTLPAEQLHQVLNAIRQSGLLKIQLLTEQVRAA